MKNLFTLVVLICFSFTAANAQDKTAVKAEKVTKIESKDSLKKAQPQLKKVDAAKIERRRTNVTRIDANNSQGIILTEEQKKARTKATAVKAHGEIQKREEK
jgi:hypothetical protein